MTYQIMRTDTTYTDFKEFVASDYYEGTYKFETTINGSRQELRVDDEVDFCTYYMAVEINLFIIPVIRTSEGIQVLLESRFPGRDGGFVFPGLEMEKKVKNLNGVVELLRNGSEFNQKQRNESRSKGVDGDAIDVKVSFGKKMTAENSADATYTRLQEVAGRQIFVLEIQSNEGLEKLGWRKEDSEFTAVNLRPYMGKRGDFGQKYGLPAKCAEVTNALFNHLKH